MNVKINTVIRTGLWFVCVRVVGLVCIGYNCHGKFSHFHDGMDISL